MTATWSEHTPDLVSLSVRRDAVGVHVTIGGEVDCASAPQVRACLEPLLTAEPLEVVVDLTGVTFLDSAGLCVLAAAHRLATERAVRLRVLAATRAVVRPLQVTGLWQLLRVEQVPAVGGAHG